jgi:hypothetical protein
MGVDIVTYRARIGGFVSGNKGECGVIKKWQDSGLAKV